MNDELKTETAAAKTSSLPKWSLVLGILGIVPLGLLGAVPAVVCGHMAMSRIRRSRSRVAGRNLAISGIGLGYLGIVLQSILVVLILVQPIRTKNRRVQCLSNLKNIGMAVRMWEMDHAMDYPELPPNFQALTEYADVPKLFICPSTGHQPGALEQVDGWADYVFVPNRKLDDPEDTVLAFSKPECHGGRGGSILFLDGSVGWCDPDEYERLTSKVLADGSASLKTSQLGVDEPATTSAPAAVGDVFTVSLLISDGSTAIAIGLERDVTVKDGVGRLVHRPGPVMDLHEVRFEDDKNQTVHQSVSRIHIEYRMQDDIGALVPMVLFADIALVDVKHLDVILVDEDATEYRCPMSDVRRHYSRVAGAGGPFLKRVEPPFLVTPSAPGAPDRPLERRQAAPPPVVVTPLQRPDAVPDEPPARAGPRVHFNSDAFFGVTGIAFSPDDRLLATASWDSTIKVWDASRGCEVLTMADLSLSMFHDLLFSKDGKSVFSSGGDGAIRKWDIIQGRQSGVFRGEESLGAACSLAQPESRSIIAAGFADGTIHVLDGEGLVSIRMLRTVGDVPAVSLAISPDAQLLAFRGPDGTAVVWELEAGREIMRLRKHEQPITCLAFSPDGRMLASGSFDGSIRIWAVPSGAALLTYAGHTDSVQSVAFSPSGERIASRSVGGLHLWSPTDGQGGRVESVGELPSSDRALAFSHSGQLLTVAGLQGRVLALSAKTGAPLDLFVSHLDRTVGLEVREGSGVLVTSGSTTLTQWGLTTNTYNSAVVFGESAWRGRTLSLDGRYAAGATGSVDRLYLWDAKTGALIREYPDSTSGDAAFAADGKTMATAGQDGDILILDVESGSQRQRLRGHNGRAADYAFAPIENLLVSVGSDGSLRCWDLLTGKEASPSVDTGGLCRKLLFSPDGRYVALCDKDRAKIWRWRDGRRDGDPLGPFWGRGISMRSAEDGTLAVATHRYWNCGLWDVSTAKLTRRFDGYRGEVHDAVLSPEGRHLIAAAEDGRILVRRLQTGEEVAELCSFENGGWLVTTPDGRYECSESAREHAYWVQDLRVIPLSEAHSEPRVPGLLARVLNAE